MCNDKPRPNEMIGNLISKMSHSAAVFNLYVQIIFIEIRGTGDASCHHQEHLVSPTQNSLLQVRCSGVSCSTCLISARDVKIDMSGSRTKDHRIQKPGGSHKGTQYDMLLLKSALHTHPDGRSASTEEGLCSSGALQSQKHLIPQIHFRHAHQGIQAQSSHLMPGVTAQFPPQSQI